jgi:ABC-type lipoprotein release transport system permease subunit
MMKPSVWSLLLILFMGMNVASYQIVLPVVSGISSKLRDYTEFAAGYIVLGPIKANPLVLWYVANPFTKSPDDLLRSWTRGGSYPYTDADVENISKIEGVKEVLRECLLGTDLIPNATVLDYWNKERQKLGGDPRPHLPQGWLLAVDANVLDVGLVPYFQISEGRFFKPEDANAILVDETTAKELLINAGQEIRVGIAGKNVTHTVIGIYNSFPLDPGGYSRSGWYAIMMDLNHLFSFFPANDTDVRYSSLFVKLDGPGYADSVKDKLEKMYPLSPLSYNKAMTESLTQQLSLTLSTSSLLSNLLLGVSVAGICVVSLIDLMRKRRELGLYTTIGWRDNDILFRLLRRSFTLGFAGSALGLILAFVMGRQIYQALISGQVKFVVNVPQIPTPELMPYALFLALGLSLLSFTVGYIYYRRITPLKMLEE